MESTKRRTQEERSAATRKKLLEVASPHLFGAALRGPSGSWIVDGDGRR